MGNLLVFIGTFAEGERLNKVFELQSEKSNTISGLQYTDSLWRKLKDNYDESIAVSIFPCSSYPESKAIFIDDFFWDSKRLSVSFNNRKFLRNISVKNNLIKTFKKLLIPHIKKNYLDYEITIFLCEPWGPCVNAACYLKTKMKKSKLIIDLPDLPFFTNRTIKNPVFKLVKYLSAKSTMNKINKYADSYILFSKNMIKYIDNKKPFVVHEGLIPYEIKKRPSKIDNILNITYAGSLDEESSNISKVFEIYNYIKLHSDKKVRFKIAGSGYNPLFQSLISKTSEIEYLGVLKPCEVRELLEKSDILISFRPNTVEFNKAFPSKMFEYICANKPVVCLKMDCFNEFFMSYFYCFEQLDIKLISEAIINFDFNVFYKNGGPKQNALKHIEQLYSCDGLLRIIKEEL